MLFGSRKVFVKRIEIKHKSLKFGKTWYFVRDEINGYVFFKNSELLAGALGKLTLGTGGKGGLFYVLIRDNSKVLFVNIVNSG
jgi:hypothetical protein